MISDVHAAAADATNCQALQQRWAFSWGTFPALWAKGVCVFPKAPLILLVFFPRDVPRMSASEQGVPFLLWQFSLVDPVQRPAPAGSSVRERASVTGVMQDEQSFGEVQCLPSVLSKLAGNVIGAC